MQGIQFRHLTGKALFIKELGPALSLGLWFTLYCSKYSELRETSLPTFQDLFSIVSDWIYVSYFLEFMNWGTSGVDRKIRVGEIDLKEVVGEGKGEIRGLSTAPRKVSPPFVQNTHRGWGTRSLLTLELKTR